jgi:hypothetical protein
MLRDIFTSRHAIAPPFISVQTLWLSVSNIANRRFEFNKRSQLLIRPHNEPLSVIAKGSAQSPAMSANENRVKNSSGLLQRLSNHN